jgi:hypothetical protein
MFEVFKSSVNTKKIQLLLFHPKGTSPKNIVWHENYSKMKLTKYCTHCLVSELMHIRGLHVYQFKFI